MTDRHATVLLVEDDYVIRHSLRAGYERAGFSVQEAASGCDALKSAAAVAPDLIILDLGLPDIDGLDILANLRGWANTPLIVLSVRASEAEKVASFEQGADDYVVKPCGMQELVARSRAALRRSAQSKAAGPLIHCRAITIDLSSRRVIRNGAAVKLTPKEYRVLEILAQRRGAVVTHQQILEAIWGPKHGGDTHYLRILIRRLRQKIEDDPVRPQILLTELGIGYRFEIDDKTSDSTESHDARH